MRVVLHTHTHTLLLTHFYSHTSTHTHTHTHTLLLTHTHTHTHTHTEHCMDIVKLAVKHRDRGVVGVDIAGDELLPMDQRHIEGFKEAKRMGLHITVHAAESGPASNVTEVYVHHVITVLVM